MSRLDIQRDATPQLVADVTMYTSENGGRRGPALPGWGCTCIISPDAGGWDSVALLRDKPLVPGEKRRLGFRFLSGEDAASALRQAGHFFLWEGRFIGEAVVVK